MAADVVSEMPAAPATRPRVIKALLAQRGLRPNRGRGQNFLVDDVIRDEIVQAAELAPGESTLEIGPGLGALTEKLLADGVQVRAIEKDAGLAVILQDRLGAADGFHLTHGDALDTDFSALFEASGIRTVISNLPYSVGTRILVNLLEADPGPDRLAITLQLDVARRLAGTPGTSEYGLLTLLAAQAFEVEIRRILQPGSFFPIPQVRSALICLRRSEEPRVPVEDRAFFKALARHAFSRRRKQMQTLVRTAPAGVEWPSAAAWSAIFEELAIPPSVRPEALPPDAWARLARSGREAAGL